MVVVGLRTADLVEMEVTDARGQGCKVDLGVFWRARAPVLLDVGPRAPSRWCGRGEDGRPCSTGGPRGFPGCGHDPGQRQVHATATHVHRLRTQSRVQPRGVRRVALIPAPNSRPRVRCLRGEPGTDNQDATRIQQLGERSASRTLNGFLTQALQSPSRWGAGGSWSRGARRALGRGGRGSSHGRVRGAGVPAGRRWSG